MTLHDRLTSFVRGPLGCECPDEALAEIVMRMVAADSPAPVKLTIEVGGRLLIHVVEEDEALEYPDLIRTLVEEGVRARDSRGFNRFRLVVAAADDAGDSARVLESRFAAASSRDDRTHLHVLPAASIPW